ncbi:hypothetical protein A8V01_09845 [Novosphingobium guangzhouense]|uniref:Uncharacterized protein n=1 Tax=Novosphingobium guangzhouense TaxID=1850347 RepID=A0A2K2FTQ4_9SPHN|nr:hypothetical protein A8V01_09845 [Novosphingobium guangzhouense]
MFFAMAGFSTQSVIGGIVLLLVATTFWLIEARLQRPKRTLGHLALGSTILLSCLVYISWKGEFFLAFLTWLGVTALALFVAISYERTAGRM